MRSVVQAPAPTPQDKPLAARAENLLSSGSKVQRSNLDEWLASDDRRRMEMSRDLAAKVRALDAQKQQKQHEEEEQKLPQESDDDDSDDEGDFIDPALSSRLSVDDLDAASINTADILSGIEESSSGSSSSDSSEGEDNEETKEGATWPDTPMSGYSSAASSEASSAIHTPFFLNPRQDMPYDIVDFVIGDLDEEEILQEQKKSKPSKRARSMAL